MSESFEIVSNSGAYSVRLGRGILGEVAAGQIEPIFIADAKLLDRLPADAKRVVPVEAEETSKALESMPEFVAQLRRLGANRDTHLVVVGGGTIQDVATFLASIYMRGLSWTYMPSTVLAMDDSCIGGKSSINVLGYKNLVGNFHPPRDIAIDMELVTTLDREMVVGGLFEAAKICFAFGAERFRDYLALAPVTAQTPAALMPIVSLSLRTKKWFIEIDEFDQKERLLLNFGHTFGHAIEGATDFGVSHGIAVGVGMLAACRFAEGHSAFSESGRSNVDALCRHVTEMLGIRAAPVVSPPQPVAMDDLLQKFEYDKKHRTGSYRLVLPQGDGSLALVSVPRDEDTRRAIAEAYRATFEQLGWPVR